MLHQLKAKLDRRWRRLVKLVLLGAPRELLNTELDLICPVVEQIAAEYGRDRWIAELTEGDLTLEEAALFGPVPDDWPESEETEPEPSAEEDGK